MGAQVSVQSKVAANTRLYEERRNKYNQEMDSKPQEHMTHDTMKDKALPQQPTDINDKKNDALCRSDNTGITKIDNSNVVDESSASSSSSSSSSSSASMQAV